MQMSSQYRAEILETQRLKQDKKKGSGDQRGKPVTSLALALSLSLFLSLAPRSTARAVGPLADSNPCAHGHAHRRSQTNRPSRDVRAVHGLQDPLHVRHEPVANPEALQGCTQLLLLCPRPSARNRSPPAASNANPGGACVGVP